MGIDHPQDQLDHPVHGDVELAAQHADLVAVPGHDAIERIHEDQKQDQGGRDDPDRGGAQVQHHNDEDQKRNP